MPQDTSTQLALVIPSYRWNALAKDTLTQAAAIGSPDIRVHIGDNSADPDKHAFLRDLAARGTNVAVTCHPTNIGADNNWRFLIQAQSAPYICMAADDDSFGPAYYRAALALFRAHPDCGTASGLLVSVAHAPALPTSLYTPAARLETDPLERIRNYHGANAICYAISPRSVIVDFAGYVEHNPLGCPFYDYILAFNLLSRGTYRIDPAGYVYIFDNSHWQLNDDFIGSNARWYQGYGLPESFGYLTRLHWAVVVVHFFSSRYRASDLPRDRADAITSYLFYRQRREFLQDYKMHRATIDGLLAQEPLAVAAFARLTSAIYDKVDALFDDFALVLGVFSPALAQRHRAFQRETLLPGVDRISPPPTTFAGRAAAAGARVATLVRRALR